MKRKFKKQFTKLLDNLGLKQYEFAAQNGYSNSAISSFINGQSSSEPFLKLLKDKYGVDIKN